MALTAYNAIFRRPKSLLIHMAEVFDRGNLILSHQAGVSDSGNLFLGHKGPVSDDENLVPGHQGENLEGAIFLAYIYGAQLRRPKHVTRCYSGGEQLIFPKNAVSLAK